MLFTINLGLYTERQHKHRVGVTKIHAGDDRQIGQPIFGNHHLQQRLVILCKFFGSDLAARASKENAGQQGQDAHSGKQA